MPKLLLATPALALLFSFAVTVAAEEDKAAAFQACATEQREKKKNALSECALGDEAGRVSCESKVESEYSANGIQFLCTMRSGINQARDINTVQESEQLARENKERERQAGIQSSPDSSNTNRPLTVRDVPLPPSRPSDLRNRPAPAPAPRPDDNQEASPERGGGGGTRRASNQGGGGSNNTPERAQTNNNGGNESPSSDNTAKNTIYDNVSLAQSEAQMDVQSCQSKQNSASLCCNNPLACASAADRDVLQRLNAGPGDDAGVTAYCRQMQGASDTSAGINTRLAATCTNNQYACSNSCASLEQKYRGYMANCENCESYSVFMNAANQLANARSSCGQLQAKGDQLTAQSLSTASTSAYSQYCQQQAGMSPQSLSPSQAAAKRAAMNASATSAATSAQAAATAQAPAQGQGSFTTPTNAKNKNSFALQDLADSGFPGMKVDVAANAAPAVRPVPNGGGGGFGSMGGGAGGAQLGSRPANRGGGGGNGATTPTEVEQGFRSGGYSQPVAGSAPSNEPSGYDGDRQPSATTAGTLDLKQYLPGGRLAPVRRLAGTNLRSEINAKEEDIFRRISLKIYEKCRLGILWRCD